MHRQGAFFCPGGETAKEATLPIEVWTSDETGTMVLMPESPDPDAPHGGGEQAPAPDAAPAPEPTHAAELRALRTMIESRDQERAAREAQRDTQLATMERLVRGEDLTPPAATTPAATVEPKAEDFASHEDYVRAAARFEAKQEVDAERQAQQQARQQEQQRAQLQSRDHAVRTQEEAFIADHPDYVDVVTRGLVAKAPPEFRQLMMLLDDAPAVAYQVAQDEALLGRLLQMPPGPLFYALGRLSASAGGGTRAPAATETTEPPAVSDTRTALASGGAPPTAGTPLAPPAQGPGQASPAGRRLPAPPRPLGGGGASGPGGYRDDMSMSDYRQWRANGGGR
jgi:hypothetical protein